MSTQLITTLEQAIEFYLTSLIRKVVEEAKEEKNGWADREITEWSGL